MSMQKCIVISNDQGSKDISSTINSYLEKGWKVVNMVAQSTSISKQSDQRDGRVIIILQLLEY